MQLPLEIFAKDVLIKIVKNVITNKTIPALHVISVSYMKEIVYLYVLINITVISSVIPVINVIILIA